MRKTLAIALLVSAAGVTYFAKRSDDSQPPAPDNREPSVAMRVDRPERRELTAPLADDGSWLSEFPAAINFQPTVELPVPEKSPSMKEEQNGTVLRVASPSSLLVSIGGVRREINLAGVVPPSACAPDRPNFDNEAQRFIESFLADEEIYLVKQMVVEGTQTYIVHRTRDRRELNDSLIRNGYGCMGEGITLAYCPTGTKLAERVAQRNGRGMWRNGDPLESGFVSETENAFAVMRRTMARQ